MSNSENNIRIVKNTIMLYFRMLLILVVSLYTVRVVLETLGVVDYGIYNVVGGVVLMFSFISNSMASAAQRFFAFEKGRNDRQRIQQTFSLMMTMFLLTAFAILLLTETIGMWFLNNRMIIPNDRMDAANWILQFSIFSFITTIVTIPYNAVIIANEKMTVYAYVSIIEVIIKLIIVYLLQLFPFDKLKLYSILNFASTIFITMIYRTICKKKYSECHYFFYWDSKMFKNILGYSGWNLLGILAKVINEQGINVLLNLFFGPIVNASRAVAYKVNSSINQFVMNYITAARPQITKYYATGEYEAMTKLVFQSSKFSYFLIFILSLPVLLETEYLLTIWIKYVPDYVVLFTRFVILIAIVDTLSYPLTAAASATGEIKWYQIVVGGVMLLNLPISFLFLQANYPPQITMYVALTISMICMFLRLIMIKFILIFSVRDFLKKVVFRILIVSIISYVFPFLIYLLMDYSLFRFILVIAVGFFWTGITIYFIGLTMEERNYIHNLKKNILYYK